jgi:N-acyl-D-amino-acid deacylase
MHEDDVRRILAFGETMIGSDGLPHDAFPHPRLWGTFPRVLGHYAREVGLFDLETAVYKMTGLPAAKFGLTGRGAIKPNYYADLVIFDAEHIADMATFEQPLRPAAGISSVLVNGQCAWDKSRATGARAGRVLRRSAHSRASH